MSFFPSRTVAVELFGFSVHWYGLLYLLGFLVGYVLVQRLQKYRKVHLSADDWSTLVGWSIMGVLAGGRLGYVFFYDFAYFALHPLKIFAVWEGGMASHGGFIGVALALFFFTRSRRVSFWDIADIVVVPIALGLMFGRLGNFINQELYGTVTTLPWGMQIPGVEGVRHPLPLYAMAKDVFIAAICYIHLRNSQKAGTTAGLFLVTYGILRYALDFLKDHAQAPLDLFIFTASREQLLTLPIILAGIGILFLRGKKRAEG